MHYNNRESNSYEIPSAAFMSSWIPFHIPHSTCHYCNSVKISCMQSFEPICLLILCVNIGPTSPLVQHSIHCTRERTQNWIQEYFVRMTKTICSTTFWKKSIKWFIIIFIPFHRLYQAPSQCIFPCRLMLVLILFLLFQFILNCPPFCFRLNDIVSIDFLCTIPQCRLFCIGIFISSAQTNNEKKPRFCVFISFQS